MNIEHFKLAIDSLRHRKLRSWLTMIGIFIGIAAVVSLIGLGEGLRNAITGQFGFIGTDILSVQASGVGFGAPGQGVAKPLSDDLKDKIKRISGIDAVFNRYIKTGIIDFNDRQKIEMFWSVAEGTERKPFEEMLNIDVHAGRLLKEGDRCKLLLGYDLAYKDFKNALGKEASVGDTVLVNGEKCSIVGIIEKKGSFIFDNTAAMNEGAMLEIFGDDGSVNIIAVKVSNENEINNVKIKVEELLRKERNVKEGDEDFEVSTPQQAISSLNSTLFAIQLFVTIIAVISLLVGGIGIMNTMYTSVIERTREIGIMKSIGAKNSTIFTLFFIESGLLGTVGGTIGVAIGLIFAYGAAAIGRLLLGSELIQAQVSIWLIIGSLLFAFVLGTMFGVLPAIQASRMQPVESLRSAQ